MQITALKRTQPCYQKKVAKNKRGGGIFNPFTRDGKEQSLFEPQQAVIPPQGNSLRNIAYFFFKMYLYNRGREYFRDLSGAPVEIPARCDDQNPRSAFLPARGSEPNRARGLFPARCSDPTARAVFIPEKYVDRINSYFFPRVHIFIN
jgi:hypothetical protein